MTKARLNHWLNLPLGLADRKKSLCECSSSPSSSASSAAGRIILKVFQSKCSLWSGCRFFSWLPLSLFSLSRSTRARVRIPPIPTLAHGLPLPTRRSIASILPLRSNLSLTEFSAKTGTPSFVTLHAGIFIASNSWLIALEFWFKGFTRLSRNRARARPWLTGSRYVVPFCCISSLRVSWILFFVSFALWIHLCLPSSCVSIWSSTSIRLSVKIVRYVLNSMHQFFVVCTTSAGFVFISMTTRLFQVYLGKLRWILWSGLRWCRALWWNLQCNHVFCLSRFVGHVLLVWISRDGVSKWTWLMESYSK